MKTPILIWTFRRTGGTTLTDLLQDLAGNPIIDQEPFNWDRCFGKVAQSWFETKNMPGLLADLDAVLYNHPTIKHCYELHDDSFNAALFARAKRHGYRQMILDREDEVGRVLSLELATQTGAWGKMGSEGRYALFLGGEKQLLPVDMPAAITQMELCQARRNALQALVARSDDPVLEVTFEQIYSNPKAGRKRVHEVLAHFGLDHADDPALEKAISNALLHRGQNSAKMLEHVPAIAQSRQQLQAVRDRLRLPPDAPVVSD